MIIDSSKSIDKQTNNSPVKITGMKSRYFSTNKQTYTHTHTGQFSIN